MPLRTATNGNGSTITVTTAADATGTNVAYLVAGGLPCIGVHLVNRARRTDGTYTPAHIKLTQHATNANSGVCQQVRNSQVVDDYFRSTVPAPGETTAAPITAAIPVGSSTSIYDEQTTTTPSS